MKPFVAPLCQASASIPPLLRNTLIITGVVACLLCIKHWDYYFGPAIFETGDYAANALQITGAKHFSEIYGNYSRWGFNHPGPAFFYVYALSELFFRDLIPVFNSPHQAHAFAGLLTQSAFFAFAVATLHRFGSSRLLLLALATAAILHFSSANEAFTSIWPPHVLIFPMMAFIVAAAAVASGHIAFLPGTVLSACFLAHGHVSQPLFIVPITLASAASYWLRRKALHSTRAPLGPWIFATAIIAIFLVPMVLDLLRGNESNFLKILNHIKAHTGERKTVSQATGYLASFLLYIDRPEQLLQQDSFQYISFLKANSIKLSFWILAIVPPTIALWHPKFTHTEQSYFRSLSALSGLAIVLTLQWGRMQDGDMYAFNGFFNYSLIYLLLIPVLLLLAATFDSKLPTWSIAAGWCAVIALVFFSPTPKGDAQLQAAPELPVKVEAALREYPQRPILLTFQHADWPKALGVVLALQRAKAPFRIAAADWKFAYWQESPLSKSDAEMLTAGAALWALTPLAGKRFEQGMPFFENWGLWRPFYTPLTPSPANIDFNQSGNSQSFSILGISEPSNAGFVWTISQRVEVYFQPFRAVRDVICRFHATPYTGDGRVAGQELIVSMNGEPLLNALVRNEELIEVRIPASTWNASDQGVLILNLPKAVSPRALGLSTDPRPLGLSLDKLTFTNN